MLAAHGGSIMPQDRLQPMTLYAQKTMRSKGQKDHCDNMPLDYARCVAF
jgi:hypothetical protein